MASDGIKVAIRSRPMSKREESLGSTTCLSINAVAGSVTISDTKKKDNEPKLFTFDFAYDTSSTQPQVYKDLGEPMVTRAIDGWNGTIFAYGQTGSGKTWTMMGVSGNEGIIPNLNRDLYERIEKLTVKEGEGEEGEEGENETTVSFQVTVAYVEIYNEVISDLLNPSKAQLQIRESPDLGIYIQGVSEVVCKSHTDVMKLITQGTAMRRVAETEMNSESSRSHSIFTLSVEKRTMEKTSEKTKETMLKSKLNLVDLAGSERASKTGATGATLKEGAAINKSLMTLGSVINALGELAKGKKVHVPYRDSKLTRLLQDSIGGNSSTLMLAALSPADYNYAETVITLQYAKRVKMVENKVERNEDVKEKEIRELKEEIEALRAALANGGAGSMGHSFDENTPPDPELIAKLRELESGASTAWAEKEKMSKILEEERSKNMSVAVGSVMENVKEKKIEAMKKIKKLQKDKERNHEKMKATKEMYGKTKKELEKGMESYKQMNEAFESLPDGEAKDKKEEDLAMLLEKIEKKRTALLKAKGDLAKMKLHSEEVDELLIEVRAELVANADLLNQNDDLRKKIVEEERAKFAAVKDEYLEKELAEERKKIESEKERLGKVQGDNRKDMIRNLGKLKVELKKEANGMEVLLKNQVEMLEGEKKEQDEVIVRLKEDIEKMEERLAEAEAAVEDSAEEMKGLRDERTTERQEKEEKEVELGESLRREEARGGLEEGEEGMGFARVLMDGFNEERAAMAGKNEELKKLLKEALGDVMYLQQRVFRMEKERAMTSR